MTSPHALSLLAFTVPLRPLALPCALLLAACSRPSPPPANVAPQAVTAVDAPAPAVDAPAPASLVELASARVAGGSVMAASPWPGAAGFDDVVAVAGVTSADPTGRAERVVTWFRRSERGAISRQRNYPLPNDAEVSSLISVDVTGDGHPELIAFLTRGTVTTSNTLQVFALPADGSGQPLALSRESAALDGAHAEAEVAARLPLSRGLSVDDVATSTTASLVGRLSYASPEQWGALASAAGIERCTDGAGNGGRRRCTRSTPAQVARPATHEPLRGALEDALEPLSLMTFECSDEAPVRCAAGRVGGHQTVVEFDGAGPTRRLRRIIEVDQGLGE
ncbi:MAG: hypothetical protein R3A52_19245 [Polyangiales bacterium]